MFSRLIPTKFGLQRFHKINKIFYLQRCYSQNKYKQSENPSPAAIELKKKGEWRDKITQEDRGQVHRILTGRDTEEDLNIDYKNPVELAHWFNRVAREGPKTMINNPIKPKPITITITGAAGAISYALLPRIARGDMLGEEQPVILKLLEVPQAMNALNGVVMELEDLASPLVEKIVATDDPKEAFTGADIAIFVGAKPRGKGQERADVLKDNAKIFAEQGKYLNTYANPEVLALVVGNPANTNALILSANAPDINPRNITAMTRLDHDRGLGLIAEKAKCYVTDIQRFCVWGNHSSTQYPDVGNTLIRGKWLRNVIKDEDWIKNTFIPTVQQRGAQIIAARGKSSAASAASAAINHIRDWVLGYNEWVSMAIPTDGTQYGIPSGIWCSMPLVCSGGGRYDIVNGVEIDIEAAKAIQKSVNELLEEKEAVKSLLPPPQFRFSFIPSTVFTEKYVANEDVTESLSKELNVKTKIEIAQA